MKHNYGLLPKQCIAMFLLYRGVGYVMGNVAITWGSLYIMTNSGITSDELY